MSDTKQRLSLLLAAFGAFSVATPPIVATVPPAVVPALSQDVDALVARFREHGWVVLRGAFGHHPQNVREVVERILVPSTDLSNPDQMFPGVDRHTETFRRAQANIIGDFHPINGWTSAVGPNLPHPRSQQEVADFVQALQHDSNTNINTSSEKMDWVAREMRGSEILQKFLDAVHGKNVGVHNAAYTGPEGRDEGVSRWKLQEHSEGNFGAMCVRYPTRRVKQGVTQVWELENNQKQWQVKTENEIERVAEAQSGGIHIDGNSFTDPSSWGGKWNPFRIAPSLVLLPVLRDIAKAWNGGTTVLTGRHRDMFRFLLQQRRDNAPPPGFHDVNNRWGYIGKMMEGHNGVGPDLTNQKHKRWRRHTVGGARAGDILVMHPLLPHGSSVNLGFKERLSINFATEWSPRWLDLMDTVMGQNTVKDVNRLENILTQTGEMPAIFKLDRYTPPHSWGGEITVTQACEKWWNHQWHAGPDAGQNCEYCKAGYWGRKHCDETCTKYCPTQTGAVLGVAAGPPPAQRPRLLIPGAPGAPAAPVDNENMDFYCETWFDQQWHADRQGRNCEYCEAGRWGRSQCGATCLKYCPFTVGFA